MLRSRLPLIGLAVVLAGAGSPAVAHVGDHMHMSLIEAMQHPFSNIDHMLALVALGAMVVMAGWSRLRA